MTDHDALIDGLSGHLRPVTRPLPAGVRAWLWLVLALPAGWLATWLLPRHLTDWSRPGAVWAVLGLALSLAAAAGAMRAAMASSIAGRGVPQGALLAVAGLGWLGANVMGTLSLAQPWGEPGSGWYCYTFVVLAGAPMIALAIAAIRRTRAVRPERSLAYAGLAIAFGALSLLSFCHPVTEHAVDLMMHVAGGLTVVGLTVLLGRRWVALA